ncbi:MAG: zinc finger domain-containing protein, partial [Thermodesulfobacteriota bacterium]|nr:zinc finger domain-containing protein [Thermodesulfobacteriota bacterium]
DHPMVLDALTGYLETADDIQVVACTGDGEEAVSLVQDKVPKNVRSEVNKAIEPVRQSGKIGHSLDTHVTLYVSDELLGKLTAKDLDLKEMLIVSKISLRTLSEAPDGIFTSEEVSGLKVEVGPTPGSKCERCWIYTEEAGTDPDHPTLCPRCAGVMALKD